MPAPVIPTTAPVPAGTAPEAAPAADGQAAPPGQFAGFNSPEELAAAYQKVTSMHDHAQSMIGQLSNEVGTLRQVVQKSLGSPSAVSEPEADPLGDDQAYFAELDQKVEDEELTPEERIMLKADRKLERVEAEKKALLKSMPKVIAEQVWTIRHHEKLDEWAKENPRFIELAKTGKLDEFVSSGAHPAVDNPYSAYFVMENQALKQEMQALRDQHAAEMAALKKIAGAEAVMEHERLRQGTVRAATVVGQDGSSIPSARPPKMTPAEQKAYFVAKARERAAAGG